MINDSVETVSRMEELVPLITETLEMGKSVRFSPKGVSMLPMLRQGIDSVVLSPVQGKLRKYDIIFYRRDNGKYVLHRIIETADGYTCIGDNQFIKEYGVRDDQILAVVSSFFRGEKQYSIDSLVYRLYCRVRHYGRPVRALLLRIARRIKRFRAKIFGD